MDTRALETFTKNNEKLDMLLCISYFSISHLSRILDLVGLNRMISYGIYLILFAYYFVKRFKMLTWDTIVYYCIMVPVMSFAVYKNHRFIESQSNVFAIILLFMPSYYFFRTINKEVLPRALRISSYFALAYLIPYYILVVRNTDYSMDYGYWIAVPICVIWFFIHEERKLYDILLFVVGTATLFVGGSRASLALTFACCFLIYFFKTPYKKRVARVLLILSTVSILGLLAIIGRQTDASSALGATTIGSRNIEKLISGEFFNLNTRMPLYKQSWEMIIDRPLGYGVLTSRNLITKWPYPHSLLLELQLDLGLIPGTVAFIAIIVLAVWLCWHYRSTSLLVMTAMVLVIDLGRLLVSYSLYYMDSVPAILALAASTTANRRFFGSVWKNENSV